VERGFHALPAKSVAFDGWTGELRRYASEQLGEPEASARLTEQGSGKLPPWAGRAPDWRAAAPPAEPTRPERLAPSRPENAELGLVPAATSPLAAREPAGNRFRRGTLMHALLQHLPDLPPHRRAEAARRWLDRPGNGLAAGQVEPITAEVMAILNHQELAPLFGPGSRAEVPLTGLADGKVVGGLVDRLAVLAARPHRGHTRAVSAPDGRLPRRATRDIPRPPDHLCTDLDPDMPGGHSAGYTA